MKQILGTDIPVFIAIIAGSIVAMIGGNGSIWVDMAKSGHWKDLFFAMLFGLLNLGIGGLTAIYTTPILLALINKVFTLPEVLVPCLGFYCGSWGLNLLRWILRVGPKIEIDPIRVLNSLRKGQTNTESEHEKVSE